MKTVLRLAAGLILVLTALSCSQRGLDARFDFESRVGAGADLAKLKSWNWVPQQYLPTGDPRIDDPAFAQEVQQQIDAELTRRNLTKTSDKPDFVVNWEAGISQSVDDADWINAYSQDQFNTNETSWEEGSLLILFVSAETGQVIWAGRGHGELADNASKSQQKNNLRKVVTKIFEKFDSDRGVEPPPVKTDY